MREVAALEGRADRRRRATPMLPHLVMPAHHDVRPADVMLRRLHGALAAAADRGPADFAELLMLPGVGARTVRALAMVAEVMHGAPCRFADPARFSLAHGGKDRQPFAVPTAVYDRTIAVLKAAVAKARLGEDERLGAIRRLDARGAAAGARPRRGRRCRRSSPRSGGGRPGYGGRSVFGWERAPARALVRVVGIEPTLCHQNWILSPARLPVPPHPPSAAHHSPSPAPPASLALGD